VSHLQDPWNVDASSRPIPADRAVLPRTLVVARSTGLFSAVTGLVLAALTLTTGEGWLRSKLTDALGGEAAGLSKVIIDAAVADAYSTLQGRSYMWIALGIFTVIVVLLGRRGGTMTAVFSVLSSFGVLGMTLIEVGDDVQAITKLLAVVAIIFAAVSSISYWTPTSRRYSASVKKQRKQG
jgi:hypothetical protein